MAAGTDTSHAHEEAPASVAASDTAVPRRRLAAVLVPLALVAVAGVLRFAALGDPPRIYFDETYYVDDARDLLDQGVETTFTVHPPVGKWVIAAGIAAFGDTPFGWRAGPALAGTATVLFTYLAGLRLFRRRGPAALAAFLVTVDGLAFTLSRISMLDAILAFWVVVAFWLLLVDRDRLWAVLPPVEGVEGTLPPRSRLPRWIAGLVLGLAIATKWSGLLALGTAVLFVLGSELLWRRRVSGSPWREPGHLAAWVGLPLILLPLAVYILSYAPWFANLADSRLGDELCPGDECLLSGPEVARAWAGEQGAIFRFHRNLEAEHPYRSTADRWPTIQRPIALYYESCEARQLAEDTCLVEPGMVAAIVALGNPAIWWPALAAYAALLWWAVGRRDWRAAAILAFLLGQYVPWLVTSRPLFFYYMAPVVPFIALALAYAGLRAGRRRLWSWLPAALAGLALAGFLYWFPVLAGVETMPASWEQRMWFDSWR